MHGVGKRPRINQKDFFFFFPINRSKMKIWLLCLTFLAFLSIVNGQRSESNGNFIRRSHVDSQTVQMAMEKYASVVNGVIKATPGENKFTLQRPEGVRTFYVYVPKSYLNSTDDFPVVFSFHGLGDTCENFGHATGFIDLSETRNFLFVYPCGSRGLMGNAWNAGTCCFTDVDDLGFTRAMVSFLQTNFRVDAKRVFTSGFSNGAMFSEVLACRAADLFKSAASVSGVVEMTPGNAQGLQACTAAFGAFNKSISVLNVHGNADWTVPFTGDAILGFPDIPSDMSAWAERNGCTNSTVQTLNKKPFTNTVWNECRSNVTVELVKNDGGGHEWPETANFDTTTYILQFFGL